MDSTRLPIIVHPKKTFFGFVSRDDFLGAWHVHVVAAPFHNQANIEIVRACTKLFNTPVQLIRGQKSSRKIISIPLPSETVERVILSSMVRGTKNTQER